MTSTQAMKTDTKLFDEVFVKQEGNDHFYESTCSSSMEEQDPFLISDEKGNYIKYEATKELNFSKEDIGMKILFKKKQCLLSLTDKGPKKQGNPGNKQMFC